MRWKAPSAWSHFKRLWTEVISVLNLIHWLSVTNLPHHCWVVLPLAFHFSIHVNRLDQQHWMHETHKSSVAAASRELEIQNLAYFHCDVHMPCHIHIIPTFHYSFNICTCRICPRYKVKFFVLLAARHTSVLASIFLHVRLVEWRFCSEFFDTDFTSPPA